MGAELVIRSVLLGAGLAMDAFSVSLADGLNEMNMKKRRALTIAGTFALFQFVMPMTGWILVHGAVERFRALEKYIPWIALILLMYIGGKMLIEGIRDKHAASDGSGKDPDDAEHSAEITETISAGDDSAGAVSGDRRLSGTDLFIQGVATSIDALSVGFTIESYSLTAAVTSSAIIGAVTLGICLTGLDLGRKVGTRLSGRASILGGVILIAIGLEIWIRGVLM